MPTLKIQAPDALFIVPEFALLHAGFLAGPDGKKRGHTDPRLSTGSVFLPNLSDPNALLSELCSGRAASAGPMLQLVMEQTMGWSALVPSLADPDALLIKEEGMADGKTRAVLVPAKFDSEFGGPGAQSTHELSAIAPATTDAAMLPEDVALDPEVLAALAAGRLRTVVSLFPGASIVDGAPVPRASAMSVAGIGFRVHPSNDLAIPMPGLSAQDIFKISQAFNQGPPTSFDKSSVLAALGLISTELGPNDAIGLKLHAQRALRGADILPKSNAPKRE